MRYACCAVRRLPFPATPGRAITPVAQLRRAGDDGTVALRALAAARSRADVAASDKATEYIYLALTALRRHWSALCALQRDDVGWAASDLAAGFRLCRDLSAADLCPTVVRGAAAEALGRLLALWAQSAAPLPPSRFRSELRARAEKGHDGPAPLTVVWAPWSAQVPSAPSS
jgi:hypothetical protein